MRLFLSSYRFGDYGDVLQELIGEEATVGVITNAKDYNKLEERRKSVEAQFDSFRELGIEPHEIDLRPFFGHADLLALELEKHKFIWVGGGNTFVLRRALRASGGDVLLRDYVQADKCIYGGESAGAIMATPTLQGVEFGDDPYIVPDGYTDEEIWDGLGFVSHAIVPHYESAWEGSERMVEVLEEDGVPYKTLNDHQVLLVVGNDEEILG